MQVKAGTDQKELERDELRSAEGGLVGSVTRAGTDQEELQREEPTSERGLVALVKRLHQRRVERRQDRILEDATSSFVLLACRWRP